MVNGTTSAVQAMIMSVCKDGDKIIMPRNVHRSAINSLIITGVTPVYINPGIHGRLGISLGMAMEDIKNPLRKIQMLRLFLLITQHTMEFALI